MRPLVRVPCVLAGLGLCTSVIIGAVGVGASQTPTTTPSSLSAWLAGAAEAMGGETRLRALAAVETSGVSVWYHREQSERPDGPWIASFTDFTDTRSFGADAVQRTARARGFSTNDWLDSSDWAPPAITLVSSGVAFTKSGADGSLTPAAIPPDLAALPVGLAPECVILTARDAADVHAEQDQLVDGYLHHVISFSYAGARVRLILNAPSLLPKAVEIVGAHPYDMFLAPWGDIAQRVTFGMWTLEPDGLRYPRLWAFSTDGQPDGSISITRVRVNPPIDAGQFALPQNLRERFVASRRRIADLPFGSTERAPRELAPGIVKVPGSFDVVEVKQDKSIVMIEAPLSSEYSAKAIADARERFGGGPVTAVVTTSDAWPHIGGVREYVARGVPIFAFELNVPILTRLFSAKYESLPDSLARDPKAPILTVVSGRTTIGSGSNRMELYPFRTATGERQMMVYWPVHRLLYTSDLFTIRNEFVFLPQQVDEAVGAVAREHLDVATAFGMHYDPVPWATVLQSAAPPRRAAP